MLQIQNQIILGYLQCPSRPFIGYFCLVTIRWNLLERINIPLTCTNSKAKTVIPWHLRPTAEMSRFCCNGLTSCFHQYIFFKLLLCDFLLFENYKTSVKPCLHCNMLFRTTWICVPGPQSLQCCSKSKLFSYTLWGLFVESAILNSLWYLPTVRGLFSHVSTWETSMYLRSFLNGLLKCPHDFIHNSKFIWVRSKLKRFS